MPVEFTEDGYLKSQRQIEDERQLAIMRSIPTDVVVVDEIMRGVHWKLPFMMGSGGQQLRDVIDSIDGSKLIMHEDANCGWCQQVRTGLWCRFTTTNGLHKAYLVCLACAGKLRIVDPGHKQTEHIESLPIWQDNRVGLSCIYYGCDNPNVEHHHWAPKHRFSDSWKWGTVVVCKAHHDEWHREMTPDMSHRKPAA